jgi:hypothetical protein
VLGLIDGLIVPLDVPLVVRDLSLGGFSVQSPSPFMPGARHHFRFTAATREAVVLDGVAVHCHLVKPEASGQVSYMTGFEFLSSARTDEAVALLIDTLASVLSLE